MSLTRIVLGFAAALAIAGAFVPALTSAQTYYYGNASNNCAPYSTGYPYNNNTYPNNYPYNNGYYQNGYCQGNLFVYLQVIAAANSFYGRQPSDFTISISGATAYPQTFPGNANGQMVSVVGSYSVTAASFQGFTPSYSSGCTGSLVQNQQTTCVITETPIYPYNYQPNTYYSNQYQYNTPYVAPYTQPAYTAPTVYVTPTYAPSLANTGFEPQDGAAIAFAAVALIALAFLSLPYVRKAFAAILG